MRLANILRFRVATKPLSRTAASPSHSWHPRAPLPPPCHPRAVRPIRAFFASLVGEGQFLVVSTVMPGGLGCLASCSRLPVRKDPKAARILTSLPDPAPGKVGRARLFPSEVIVLLGSLVLLGVSVLDLPLSSFLYRLALVSSEFFGKLSHRCFHSFDFSFTTKWLLSIFFSAGCRKKGLGL